MTALLLSLAMNVSFSDRLYDRINADYWSAKSNLYREAWSSDKQETDAAFNWSVGVMISALNARAKHDASAKTRLQEYLTGVRKYWNRRPPVPGFDVVPNPGGVDRYYDDNAWMALALMESSKLLGDPKLMTLAKGALDHALSGEDDKLGGGIYWRESDRASKNTCSNAPTAFACFRYADLAKDDGYRVKGRRILAWTLAHLQDPADGLLWDNVNLKGNVDEAKYSYNTALTVRALAANGKRAEARALFGTAWKRWRDAGPGMNDTGRFAHLLCEAGLDLGFLSKEEGQKVAQELEVFAVGERFGGDWNRKPGAKRMRFELIDQASVLRFLELVRPD
jgi:predicted alpha-1,6-mannanase (GH76 family)